MQILPRQLGLGSLIAISISAMLGSGIFVLPGIVIHQTGPSAWLAYLLAAICVLPAAFSKSELSTAMPTSGGTYVYLERTFGPLVGTIAGLGLCLSLLLKSSFALVGFGAYLAIFTTVPVELTALALLAAVLILNLLGVMKVGGTLVFIVTVTLGGLLALATVSLFSMEQSHLTPFLTEGLDGLFSATALVFVSFAGVTKIAAIAEEAKNPEKNLPRGILLSLFIVTIVYCGVTFSLSSHLPSSELYGDLRPIYTLSEKVAGPMWAMGAAVLGVVAMTSMANAGILAASRFPFAMSRDLLLPPLLSFVHPRFLTPIWSILLSGVFIAAVISFLNVEKIAKLASAFMLVLYAVENVAVIILRETRVQWYKPGFKSPFYPWMQIFGMVSCLTLLFYMGGIVFSAMLAIIIPGTLLFFFYGRKQTGRRGVIGIRGRRRDFVEETYEDFDQRATIDFSRTASVVISLFGNERSPEMVIEMGSGLANDRELEVIHLKEVPEQTVLTGIEGDSPLVRALRRRIQVMAKKRNLEISFDAIVSHDIYRTIFDVSKRLHCRWLVTEWRGKTSGAFTIHNPMGWLRDHLSCNLATFRDAGVRYIRKILVLIQSEGVDGLVIHTADHLAQVHEAELVFVRCLDEDAMDEVVDHERRILEYLVTGCQSKWELKILKSTSQVDAMISESVEYDLFIFGISQKESRFRRIFGSDSDRLIEKAACSVIAIQMPQHVRSFGNILSKQFLALFRPSKQD